MVVLVLLIGKCFQIDNMVVTNSHIRRDTPLFLKNGFNKLRKLVGSGFVHVIGFYYNSI